MVKMRTRVSKILFTLLIVILPSCYWYTGHAHVKKHLWPRWEVNNPLSNAEIDHSPWQQFLTKYVSTNNEQINLVDYAHVSSSDKKKLNEYLDSMSKIDIDDYNRNEQLAYWVNLYNALTVKLILEHYPIDSIRDINISPGIFSIGPWNAKVFRVKNINLTLNDIEHRILRPIWNDPRIHYILNCGAIGCPNLSKHAYIGKNIDQMLNDAAVAYINSLRGVQVIEGKVVASRIYDWYQEDFGNNQAMVLEHISLFASPTLKKELKGHHKISDYIYNWHLNEIENVYSEPD